MMRCRMRHSRSFTLIELIVVTTIVSIIAVTAAPLFGSTSQRRLGAAASQLAADLRYARGLAVATRRHTWVTFQLNNERYRVRIESSIGGGRENRVNVTHPITGAGNFRVDLDTGDYAGIEIQSASFGGRKEVEFDRFGRPYNGQGTLLADDGTVVLSTSGGTRTVRVVAETGMVRED